MEMINHSTVWLVNYLFLLLTSVGHKLGKNWKNKNQTVGKNCLFFIWYTTVFYVHKIKLKLFLVTRFLDSDVYRFLLFLNVILLC